MTDEAFISVKPLIKIDGEENRDLNEALSSMVINLPLSGMAHGELSFSNWIRSGDDAALGFGFQEIGFGKRIEILMGEENTVPIFSGDITAVEERYGNSALKSFFSSRPNAYLSVSDIAAYLKICHQMTLLIPLLVSWVYRRM